MKNLYAKHSLVRGIKPINSKYKVSGFIRTAETNSDDWGTCIKAIYECNPNEILFIKCSNEDYAVWGELASTAAKKHGLLATVIFGSSRDTNDVLKLDYPLFSSSIQSRAGGAYNNGTIGEDIIIDDLIIRTGDFIICDVDGVVVVNKENLDEVLEEVNKIKEFENNCLRELFDEDKQLDTILDL
ncbi:MAG: hypothetical protein BZ138_04170 [Methanosphaera sp. rholeuAM270]|nr:MAG: hypothetical protein BZ138_04170 [Methanosphaera sp. rholeuAM270]